MRMMAVAVLLASTDVAFAEPVGASDDSYLCSADLRCYSDRACDAYQTRMYVTRQPAENRIEMRWPERDSPNTRYYALIENDSEVEMAGFLPTRQDGFGAATFQLYRDMAFLSAGISHGIVGGEVRNFGVTVQGTCRRIEN